MNYNINFQVAAVIITALLLYHFLTQKKLHNANVKTFTYILVLSGLYILSDLLGTLTIMNYTAEDEGTVMGILTGIYLLDILIPYILYSCIPDSRENEKKSGALSVICAGITVAMMIAVLGNLGSGGFFCFDSNGVFQKGTGYVFLYLYALVYIVLIMQRMIRSREDYTPEKMSIAGEFLVIEGVCIGVELYTGYIFLSDFGLALGLIFLYLMMNNPGDYIDSTTGAFDKRYFDNWIQEKFTKGIEFHVIAVELFMLKQINKVYGSSTGDLLLVQIARELQNIHTLDHFIAFLPQPVHLNKCLRRMLQVTVHDSHHISTGLRKPCENRCFLSEISGKKNACHIRIPLSCLLNFFPCPVAGTIVYNHQLIGNLRFCKNFRQHPTGFPNHQLLIICRKYH